MKKRTAYIIAGIVAIVIVAAGVCWYFVTLPPPAPLVVKIGALEPLSGPFAPWGTRHLKGAEMAVEEINAKGGVLGRRIELVVADDKNDIKEAITIYKRMVEVDGVVAVMGPVSSDIAIAVGVDAEKLKVPVLLHMAGSHKILKKDSRYTFRTNLAMAGPKVVDAVADIIKERGYTKVGAIIADYAWGHSIRDGIEWYIATIPGVTVHIEVAPVKETDFTTYLRKIEERIGIPQIMVQTGHPPGFPMVIKQCIELGIKPELVTGMGFPPEMLWKVLGPKVFDLVIDFASYNYSHPEYIKLGERFFAKHKLFFDQHVASGYLHVHLIAWAIEKSKSFDPKVIADTIRTGEFKHPIMLYPFKYEVWGCIKDPTMGLAVYKPGPPPGAMAPGYEWHLEVVFVTKPIKAWVPEE